MSWLTDAADEIRRRQELRDVLRARAQAEMLTDADVADDFLPGLADQPQDAP